ncbi:MAG: ComEC/Rec2 family competence protein [Patescibacteria group bacterium]
MHKSQIFFYLLAAFLVGIFTASVFNVSQVFIYVGLIAAIGCIGVFGYNKNFNARLLLAGFLGIAFLFGVIRFNSANFDKSRLDIFTDVKAGQKEVEFIVDGYIDSEPVNRGSGQQFVVAAKEVIAGDKRVAVKDKIIITTNSFPKLNYGDMISARGALRKPTNIGPSTGSGQDEFDYVTYLKKEGIRTTMFYPEIDPAYDTMQYHKLGRLEKAKISLYRKIFAVKNKFEGSVNRSVSEPNAAFINGILLGTRQNIPGDLKDAFNKTGTTHILAISGYNIMIISWAVLEVLIFFFRRRVAFWLSVFVVVLFTILTGASASVVRASIMGLFLLLARGYGRIYDPKNLIILAGAAMVWFNPLSMVFDIGFQLSFAAVLGLIYLYPYIDSKLKRLPKFGTLKEITLMTISAQLVVAPLLIYYFKNFSFVSLPANVLVAPFLPAAMLLGFLAGLGGMVFLPLGQLFGWFAWAITGYQLSVVKLFSVL